jgi:8-oxo-dGTP pyrophosphatase MutT (NUDIX family)
MRSTFPVAVHVLFLKDDAILLLRRFNTGYEDGNYSVVAGHLEAGETVLQAAIRESYEEAGVRLEAEALHVGHVMHRRCEDERVDFFVVAERWTGQIVNREPTKCDELAWHPLAALPDNVIAYVRHGIACCRSGLVYSEFGWPDPARSEP